MQFLKGYNGFHKTVAIGLIILVVLAILRGFMVISGGNLLVKVDRTLTLKPKDIWPYIVQPDLRDNWVVELVDHAPLSGQPYEVESSRLLFWKRDFRRWSGTETTETITPQRFYRSYIVSQTFRSNWTVELEALGNCQTKISYSILMREEDYTSRYFAFLKKSTEAEKLGRSLDALDEWASRDSDCEKEM
ncbi:SRPBCC family protein [Temperatibacter marinus]|uniref:SRPBCC family protein n=1 Tax=Temperatibacter marinus TaxID=1456591 RepID=A0AA52EHY9_9PROT|nr:SRPBCC family protein [Temperatibacter marinus]WND02877.1 SRPBCC family protein [Temperatibacter marinus]